MWTILFMVMFFGLLSAGMPIFLVLGACAAVLYAVSGQPMIGVAQVIIDHLNSSTLMSLPLFVMAAAFMRQGGVAKALVDVSAAWLGGIRGSLGLVTVVACTLFAAICGSSVATALAMGTILLPAMIERGYPRSFALGVIGASGTIGIVIPPSLALILYGIVAEQSVPRLFLAGILPGLLQAAAFFGWVWYDARRRNFPMEPSRPLRERLAVTVRALPALAVPVIVLVGIYGGIVTVTEAAALAAAVALLISLIFYRGFRLTQTVSVIADALRSAGTIMLIVATALAFGHWMTESGVPAQLVTWDAGAQPADLGVFAVDQCAAADPGLLPGGCGGAAAGYSDPGAGAEAAWRGSCAFFHYLYPQHGDCADPSAGWLKPLCSVDDLGCANWRSHQGNTSIFGSFADRTGHHHLCSGA